MRYIYLVLLAIGLAGCSTKMAYLNTSRMPEEINNDEAACQAEADKSDFKDPELKKNKVNQCMEKKGYKIVSEEEVVKLHGFKQVWIKPNIDFKSYDVIFIDKVDVSKAKLKETGLPSGKTSGEELANLGKEMSGRFSKYIGVVLPVVSDKKEISGRKALCLTLEITEVGQADVMLNMASEAMPVSLPIDSEGLLAFKGSVSDFSTGEKLIHIQEKAEEDRNASLAGTENFGAWQHAYNIMDYWADHLASLIAKARGQEYKSQLGIKIF